MSPLRAVGYLSYASPRVHRLSWTSDLSLSDIVLCTIGTV